MTDTQPTDTAARTYNIVAPVRSADGKLTADLDRAKVSVRIVDAVDRLDGMRPGALVAVWEYPDTRPNPAEASEHAAALTPDAVMVQIGDGELLLLDRQYRYGVTTD